MLYHVLVKRWRQGALNNLCCLGPSTRELGGDLTIRKHGLAQLGEAVGMTSCVRQQSLQTRPLLSWWTISNWRTTSLLLATRLCIIVFVISVLCTFRLKVVFNSYGIILSVRASVCQRCIICQNDTNPGSLFRGIQPHYEKKILCIQMTFNTFLKELRI